MTEPQAFGGPWSVYHLKPGQPATRKYDSIEVVKTEEHREGGFIICRVNTHPRWIDNGQALKTAQLLSASPEMLEALEAAHRSMRVLLHHFETVQPDEPMKRGTRNLMDKMGSAIAKATGAT